MNPTVEEPMRRICVFCGSSSGTLPVFADAAARMGKAIAARDYDLVYGAGTVGLMGVVAEAAHAGGAEVIGVIPDALVEREGAYESIGEIRVVGSMYERKEMMFELSDAFVALPGGFGTLDELSEVLTWTQLGLQDKPCGLLDVDGYFDPLLAQFDRGVELGFIHPEHRSLLLDDRDPEDLLDRLARYEPPARERWIDADDV